MFKKFMVSNNDLWHFVQMSKKSGHKIYIAYQCKIRMWSSIEGSIPDFLLIILEYWIRGWPLVAYVAHVESCNNS